LSAVEEAKRALEQQRAARENPAYAPPAKDECGRILLAGKSVDVPFVGAAAAPPTLQSAPPAPQLGGRLLGLRSASVSARSAASSSIP